MPDDWESVPKKSVILQGPRDGGPYKRVDFLEGPELGHSGHFRGISGLHFRRPVRELPSLYDLVLLDFGSNDLSAGCSPEILVNMVIFVAETLVAN